MLKLEQALLVEGKYDAARLSNIVDGRIRKTGSLIALPAYKNARNHLHGSGHLL